MAMAIIYFGIIICCLLTHLYLAHRQEARHIRDIKNIRKILNRSVKDKVKRMTQSRRVSRCNCCLCHGHWEMRQQRMTLSSDILGPVDRYLEEDSEIRTRL